MRLSIKFSFSYYFLSFLRFSCFKYSNTSLIIIPFIHKCISLKYACFFIECTFRYFTKILLKFLNGLKKHPAIEVISEGQRKALCLPLFYSRVFFDNRIPFIKYFPIAVLKTQAILANAPRSESHFPKICLSVDIEKR